MLEIYQPVARRAEDVLCAKGSISDEMFVLISGRLGVFSADGVQVAALDPVTTVGEMGIITRQVRVATVKAVEASNLLVVEKGPFELMLRNDVDARAQIYRNIIEILSGKLVNDNVRTRDHLLEEVKQEERNNEYRRRAEITLKILLAGGDLEREEALTQIDEALLGEGHPLKVLVVDGVDGLNAARPGGYDLIITDVNMPRMTGKELVRHIKKDPNLTSLPMMIVSYKDHEENRMAGLEAGANYYLTKNSFRDETLIEAVEDLIGRA